MRRELTWGSDQSMKSSTCLKSRRFCKVWKRINELNCVSDQSRAKRNGRIQDTRLT